MIVCRVVLYDPERDAATEAVWSGRMWFRRVPVKGELIVLSGSARGDWPADLAGGEYAVETVMYEQTRPEDENPPLPGIGATRVP